jgi:hypothetical protein
MTAVNVLIQRDAVHMITDGTGIREDDYVVVVISTKQFAVPGVRAVCGLRGCILVQNDINTALRSAKIASFDLLKANLGSMVAEVAAQRSPVWDAVPWTTHPGGEFDLFVAGWSETTGPSAFCFSHRRQPDGTWSLSLHESSTALIAPSDCTIDMMHSRPLAIAAQQQNGPNMEPLLLGLMSMQRLSYPVGGHADLTTITADKIETRRIAKWPDVIGQKMIGFDPPTRISIPLMLEFPSISTPGSAQMISAGAVKAIAIESGSLTSDSGVFGTLGVKSLSLSDNAVTVPQTQSFSNQLGPGGSWPGVLQFDVYVDTAGLAGKTMNLFASCTATLLYAASTAVGSSCALFIQGVQIARNESIDRSGVVAMSGGYAFTANGAVMGFHVQVDWANGGNVAMTNRTLFAMVTKR